MRFLKEEAKEQTAPHLLARFLARQVGIEARKLLPRAADATELAEGIPQTDAPSSVDYSLWDHVERLRFLDTSVPDEEQTMTVELFRAALPGLEEFLSDERHATLKGKLLYNMIGVTYPPSTEGVSELDPTMGNSLTVPYCRALAAGMTRCVRYITL